MASKKPIEPKKCIICGKEFYNKVPTTKTCCKECGKQATRLHIIEQKRLKSIEQFKDNPEAKTCRICGYMGLDLLPHITLGHKMPLEEYCKRFFCRPEDIMAKSVHEKRSLAQKNSTNPNKKRFSSENNPAKGHGGKYSPFSKNFIGYEGLSEEEKQAKVLEVAKKANDTTNEHQNRITKLEYYTSRGMTEEEARQALSERQRTFSLEKCIEKYGVEAGTKRWQERQELWQKNYKNQNFSWISQELFIELDKQLTDAGYNFTTYYAVKGKENENNEFILKTKESIIRPDYYIEELPLAIEFDGSYFHETLSSAQSRDEYKNQAYAGMNIPLLRIPEKDFRQNRNKTVKTCMDFIIKIASEQKQHTTP